MTWLIGGLQSIDANQQRLGSSGYLRMTCEGMLIRAALPFDPGGGPDIDDAGGIQKKPTAAGTA